MSSFSTCAGVLSPSAESSSEMGVAATPVRGIALSPEFCLTDLTLPVGETIGDDYILDPRSFDRPDPRPPRPLVTDLDD